MSNKSNGRKTINDQKYPTIADSISASLDFKEAIRRSERFDKISELACLRERLQLVDDEIKEQGNSLSSSENRNTCIKKIADLERGLANNARWFSSLNRSVKFILYMFIANLLRVSALIVLYLILIYILFKALPYIFSF